MICARCGFNAAHDSQFCESCGEPLPVGSATNTPARLAAPCACGAAPDKIDAAGVCTVCGAIRSARERDSFVVTLSDRIAACSDLGQRHWRNEDYVVLASEVVNGQQTTVFVVSDGVSSAENGDTASEQACKSACGSVIDRLRAGNAARDAIGAAIEAAQEAVLAIAYSGGERKQPPEATLVVGVIQGSTMEVGWLGDSRVYVLALSPAGLTAKLVTEDHSWVNMVVKAGEMPLDDALRDRRAHMITQSLGPLEPGYSLDPSFVTVALDGAAYVIGCSDGFWNYAHERPDLEPSKVAELVQATPEPRAAETIACHLVEFANHAGGIDNITVAVMAL
jgi:serine/threonine protein phosphatase PrpC